LSQGDSVVYRRLVADELERLGEIDRTEQIDTLYVQRGRELEERTGGDWSAPAWFAEGTGEHSVAHQIGECRRQLAAGGIALGAFADERLVGTTVRSPRRATSRIEAQPNSKKSDREAVGFGRPSPD